MSSAAREAQVRRLAEARAADSAAKTRQALAAVARLHAAGQRVTFTRVAEDAAVSTWFTYYQAAVAAAIRAAQQDQAEHGLHHTPSTQERVSATSLRTDLEHSRDEVRSLRKRTPSYASPSPPGSGSSSPTPTPSSSPTGFARSSSATVSSRPTSTPRADEHTPSKTS